MAKAVEWFQNFAREEPAPFTTAADGRVQRQFVASTRLHDGLKAAGKADERAPKVPVALPTVDGLQDLVDHQTRITANLAEIDAEEVADRAAVEQRKAELTAAAAQSILAGRSAESEPFAKVQEDFARRQENRRLRQQALADAKVTVDVAVRTQLTNAVREFFLQMKRRTAALVEEQARALCAFRDARAEEEALQRQALREIGRVHKMLPHLDRATGGGRVSLDRDQRLLEAFLDGNIGVPKLVTSGRQVFRHDAIEQWLRCAKEEGHDVD